MFPCHSVEDIDVRDAILALLDIHAAERSLPFTRDGLVLALDEDRVVRGGLVGRTNYGWLRIELLAVDPTLRGGGWGRALIGEAETIARTRGCRAAWVDTFSFQAPGFYERVGYRCFGVLEDYPQGFERRFYTKAL